MNFLNLVLAAINLFAVKVAWTVANEQFAVHSMANAWVSIFLGAGNAACAAWMLYYFFKGLHK